MDEIVKYFWSWEERINTEVALLCVSLLKDKKESASTMIRANRKSLSVLKKSFSVN